MEKKLKSLLIGSATGALIYQIAVYLIGFTSAISIPSYLINWSRANHVAIPTIIAWDILIVQFIGVGILVLFVTYLLSKRLSIQIGYFVFALVVTESIFFLIPTYLNYSKTHT